MKPLALDHEISDRLKNILKSTGWFIRPEVHVKDGVVFLEGGTGKDEYKKWASDLARNTQDSVAVVNHIHVMPPSIYEDFDPVIDGLMEQWRAFLRTIPSIIFGLLILVLTWISVKIITLLAGWMLQKRLKNPLLQRVICWAIGLAVCVVGLYTVFHLMGLTDIALTVIGGTGLLGIILGIAFKDITENLLASIFLSVNNPFNGGDLIEIDGITGYVKSLNVRSTVLVTLDGNYVQIPNSKVYKNNICNYTVNSNRREDFTIELAYTCPIADAQDTAMDVLMNHPVILKNPEPWVLVESIVKATILLRIYFWLDAEKHSRLKVKSSVIRLVKQAFQAKGLSMANEQRERIFPEGLTVRMISESEDIKASAKKPAKTSKKEGLVATTSEGALNSDAEEIKEQALESRIPEDEKNLLKNSSSN
ncbi:MAG: mechanosensitive ion channel family protein [Chlamydiales bacterium]|nr:mechanosensitive ion channel family protein [Chlamydiales bacterium]